MIGRTFENLQHATIAKDIFQKNKIIDSKRHPANLGQLHCSSKIASSFQSFTVFCCEKNCFCFHYIKEDSTEFILKSNFHCEASNLIYVIICSFIKQAEQYIKQAEGKLNDKLYIHCQAEEHIRIVGEKFLKFSVFCKLDKKQLIKGTI